MTSPYWVKGQCYNSWEYVPTIVSDRDSDPIGVMIPQTQDVQEQKVQHKQTNDIVRFSGNELWKRVLKQEFISKPRRGRGGG